MPTTAVAKAERVYIDADMTKNDIIAVLEDLRFGPGPSFQIVAIDKPVRDYLVSILKTK